MSFNISAWSIRNPIATLVLSSVLALTGYFSFLGLGIELQPNIDIPAVTVTVTRPGAGPEELETQVTRKIEDAVAALGDIDEIASSVNEGTSTTTVNFILGTDSDRATNDVRNVVARARQDLPGDVDEPVVERLEFAGGPVMTYTVSSPRRSLAELSALVDRTIARALTGVSGVARVRRLGGVEREVRVDLAPERLLAYGLTATGVNDQIRDFNLNLPGGRSQIAGAEQTVRTLGSARTVEELRNYRISLPSGDTVALKELGTVSDGSGDPRQAAFLDGRPAVGFSILRSPGSTLVTVEKSVRSEVAKLERELDDDIRFRTIFSAADSIRESYEGLIGNLTTGCIMTVIAVGLFLRDPRATAIAGLALPLSIFPTFLVMRGLNYTLNGMTLLALALALGNLVDDAVCMLEDIDQHLAMGKKPLQAALDASREIGLAVLASAAAIVAVFLPVAFMGGIPGQFFQPFGVTVAVSTLFSSLVAVTVTPMLGAYILKPKKNGPFPGDGRVRPRFSPYRSLLSWALRHRAVTLLVTSAFFIGSLQLVPLIPKGLFGSGDTGLSVLSIELPPGAPLEDTIAVAADVNALLQENPAVASVLAVVGSEGKVNQGSVYVNLLPEDRRSLSQQEFEEGMRREFRELPGARVFFQARSGAGSSKDVEIILKSEDGPALAAAAWAIERQVRALPGFVEVSSGVNLVKPEILIVPDPERAAEQGVSVLAIARTASLALIGDNDSNLAKFNLSDRQIPIRVKIAPSGRGEIETLQNLRVPGRDGRLVPLDSVATFRLGSGQAEISRFDRQREVKISANLEGIALGTAVSRLRSLAPLRSLPPGVTEEPSGDAEIMREIFGRFAGALGLAAISIYGILVLLYSNFLYPLAILTSLPLSIGGTLLALLLSGKELGLYALIGIVLLMGLVTKNAILLVDFALTAIREGRPRWPAVLESGTSRLRPIVMTSVSTIAGMVPIALAWGAYGETRSPMAIAVIGGFTTSTLLTLVVVPVIFTYVDSFYRGWMGWFTRRSRDGNRSFRVDPH